MGYAAHPCSISAPVLIGGPSSLGLESRADDGQTAYGRLPIGIGREGLADGLLTSSRPIIHNAPKPFCSVHRMSNSA